MATPSSVDGLIVGPGVEVDDGADPLSKMSGGVGADVSGNGTFPPSPIEEAVGRWVGPVVGFDDEAVGGGVGMRVGSTDGLSVCPGVGSGVDSVGLSVGIPVETEAGAIVENGACVWTGGVGAGGSGVDAFGWE